MRAPFSFLKSSGGGPPPFDPATLSLSGWWRAGDYDGATTWSGAASLGASGSRDLTGVNTPTNGTPLNGHAPVSLNGTNQYFTSGIAISSFIAASDWAVWALVNMTNEPSDFAAAIAYNNAAPVADNGGYWGTHVRSGGGGGPKMQAYNYPSAAAEAGFSNAAYALLQGRYTGGVAEARVNGGIWQTASAADVSSLTGLLRVGIGYSGSLVEGLIADLAVADTRFDDATFDDIRAYVNDRYALSV